MSAVSTSPEAASSRWTSAERRTLGLLGFAGFAAATAGMVVPGMLATIAGDLAWSPTRAGHLVALYAIGFAVAAPVLGAAFARACRKHLVVGGLALVAAGSLASALAPGSPWLEVARVVVAAGGALVLPGAAAIAGHLFPAARTRALTAVLAGPTVAVVVGLPLGTYAAATLGWRLPLAAAAAVALAAAVLTKLRLPGGIFVPPVPLAAWRALLADPRTYPVIGLSTLQLAAVFTLYAYVAPYLHAVAGIEAAGLAWLLFGYGLVSVGVTVVLLRVPLPAVAVRPMAASLVLLAVSLGALGLVGAQPWGIALLFGTWSVASTAFGTLQQARLLDVAPGAGPAVLALGTSAAFAGQGVGSLIGGATIALAGLPRLPAAAAAVALVALAVYAASRRLRLD